MEEARSEYSERTSPSLEDRAPEKPRRNWLGWGIVLLVCSPFICVVLISGCMFVGWQAQVLEDRMQGPLRLQEGASATSPDGTCYFQAKSDGTAQLIESKTGIVVQTEKISVDDYRRVEAQWQDNQHVVVTCYIRYPALMNQLEYLWDRKSGAVTDRGGGNRREFKL